MKNELLSTRTLTQIVALFSVLFGSLGAARADLVSHWPLDAHLRNEVVGGDDLTLETGDPRGGDGVLGPAGHRAVVFDGVDDAVTAPGGVANATGYSVAFWVRAEPQANKTIYVEMGEQFPSLSLGSDSSGGRLQVAVYSDVDGTRRASRSFERVFDGHWHHVVWVGLSDRRNRGILYVDGQPESPMLSRFPNQNPPLSTFVGRGVSVDGEPARCCYFDGSLDDLRIYDHALSQVEVQALFGEVCPVVDRLSFSPTTLPPSGGEIVLRSRNGLDPGLIFEVGESRLQEVAFQEDGTALAQVPPLPLGNHRVTVRCHTAAALGAASRLLTIAEPNSCDPVNVRIDSVEPSLVLSDRTTRLTIHGSGFSSGHLGAKVGTRFLTNFTVVSNSVIVGDYSPTTIGDFDLGLICETEQVSVVLPNAVEVARPIEVRSISPRVASVDGGTELTVSALHLNPATRVFVDGVPLENARLVTTEDGAQAIVGVVPAGVRTGRVDVSVADARGTQVFEGALEYVLPDGMPGPMQIESSIAEGTIRLSWHNPVPFSSVLVTNSSGQVLSTVAGGTSSVEITATEDSDGGLFYLVGETQDGERTRPEAVIIVRPDCARPPPLDAIREELRGRFEGLVYEDAEFSLYGGHAEANVVRCADPDPLLLQAIAPPERAGAMAPGVGSIRPRSAFGNSEVTTGFVLEEDASRIEIALHYRKLQPEFGLQLRCRIAKVGPEPGFVDEFTMPDVLSSDTNDWHIMTYFRADSDVGRELEGDDDPGPQPCPGDDCVGFPIPAGEYTLTFYAVGASPSVAYYSVTANPSPEELLIPRTPCPPYPLVRVRDVTDEQVLPFIEGVSVSPPLGQWAPSCRSGLFGRRLAATGYALDECNQTVPLTANDDRFEYRFTVYDSGVPYTTSWSHRNWIERCFDCGCYRVDVEVRVRGCPVTRVYEREIVILPNTVACHETRPFEFLYPQPEPGGITGIVGLNHFTRPLGTRIHADKRPLDFAVLVSPNCNCPDNFGCPSATVDEIEFDFGYALFIGPVGGPPVFSRYVPIRVELEVEDSLCSEIVAGPKYFRVSLDDLGSVPAQSAFDDYDPTNVYLIARAANSGDNWVPVGNPLKLYNPPTVLSGSSWRCTFSEPNYYFFSVQSSEQPEHNFDLGASSAMDIELPAVGDGQSEDIQVEGHPDNNICTGFTSRFSLEGGVWSDEDGVGGVRGSMMGVEIAGAPLQVSPTGGGGAVARLQGAGRGAGGGTDDDENRLPEWEWCSGGNIFNYEFREDIYKGVIYTGTIWVIPVTVWASIGFGFFLNVDYQLTSQIHPFSIIQGFEPSCPENAAPPGQQSLADAYFYLLADAGISIPASVKADIFFGVASIAIELEPQANLSFTPWLEAHANASVSLNPPSVEFDSVLDTHMYLDARFKLFARVKACIFWEAECVEYPENAQPIINQPIFTCQNIVDEFGIRAFDCECPACIETCDEPLGRECAEGDGGGANGGGANGRDQGGRGAGARLFSVHEQITIPTTAHSPNGRRTLDVWMSADESNEGILNLRENEVGVGPTDYIFTLRAANPFFLDPAAAYISDDVALIAFTEIDGTGMEVIPPLDGSNTAEHVAAANRNAARTNIRVHALSPDVRPGGIIGTNDLIRTGVDVSEASPNLEDWRVDGSATIAGLPSSESAWLAWVRYKDDFLEHRGDVETLVYCDTCPPRQPFTKQVVPDIQPRIDSAAIYVHRVTYDDANGVGAVPGYAPTPISAGGINVEPKLAAVANGDLAACVWVHDGLHENLVDDNRGRNLQFASWDTVSDAWSAPVPVVREELLDEYPGILEPRIVIRRRDGYVDGLLAFTALPRGADPNDTGLGGLRYLYLVRFEQLPGGNFGFEDPVRLRGSCDARVYTWDYELIDPVDDILVDPGEVIAKHGPDWVTVINQRGVPGTQASSGEVMVSVLGQGQDEWTAPVSISDGTRVISNVSASITPEGEVRTMYLDGGAARAFGAGQGGGAGDLPQGVQTLTTALWPDLAIASCKLSQQFPGPGARVRATVRVENRGLASSAMDAQTGENLAGLQIVYHEASGETRVVAEHALTLLEPGASEEVELTIEMPHDPVVLEACIVSNPDDLDETNDSRRCDFGAPAPESVVCDFEQVGDDLRVIVEWDNPISYGEVLIYRDGLLLTRLPGSFERFVDNTVEAGTRLYEVRGCIDTSASLRAACQVEVIRRVDSDFRRGDANGDGFVDISDSVFTLLWLFTGRQAPDCPDAADTNDSGVVDITDPIALLSWLYAAGPRPAEPGPVACGADPTEDALPECVSRTCP